MIKELSFIFTFFIFSITSSALAQKAKPNIIIILADDMGYSDIGCFGSEIQTPNLDAMAKGGLRMTQFYNASRCCPTRASLLTGLYQHQAGVGDMVNTRTQPAYQGYLNHHCVTIAEALRDGGYNTLMAGKWHVGTTPDKWPRKRGFNRYFGLIDGASSYFSTKPYRPNQKLTIALDDNEFTTGPGFYATNAYTDYSIKFIDDNKTTNKPFFLYLAFTAPHWPLHALPADIAKYKGKYNKGWDVLREERLKRMQQSGVLDKETKLSPRNEKVIAWSETTAEEKLKWSDKMAVYAAMVDRLDQNVGRVLKKLKETGDEKNTIILFLSDNGASNESISGTGFTPEMIAANKNPPGDAHSFSAYEWQGANLSNTPFRMCKKYEYEGGTAAPFIAYYPGVIKPNIIDKQPAHIIDIMSTCLDLAGINYPSTYKGNTITASEGISLLPLFKGDNWNQHKALYFEHEGNRAVRQGDWKLVSEYPANTWQLYNIKTDRTELNDLSASQPQKVAELKTLYEEWTKRAGVIPFEELDKKANKAE
ncbi:MAG: arylsulfatase [Chitinophagaceae bacterium]